MAVALARIRSSVLTFKSLLIISRSSTRCFSCFRRFSSAAAALLAFLTSSFAASLILFCASTAFFSASFSISAFFILSLMSAKVLAIGAVFVPGTFCAAVSAWAIFTFRFIMSLLMFLTSCSVARLNALVNMVLSSPPNIGSVATKVAFLACMVSSCALSMMFSKVPADCLIQSYSFTPAITRDSAMSTTRFLEFLKTVSRPSAFLGSIATPRLSDI